MSGKLRQSFIFHFGLVIGLCVLLYLLFFAALGWVTRHGEEIEVPEVTSMSLDEATRFLESRDFSVEVDSAFDPKKGPVDILSQIPLPGEVVKKGRKIYITVNRVNPPMATMPDLLNLSFRSATMVLKNSKLILSDTSHRPDIAKEAVLEQIYQGRVIRPGEQIPQGSRIHLVVGDGLGQTEFDVPDVVGLRFEEAAAILSANRLQFTVIWEGVIRDSAVALVTAQFPQSHNAFQEPNRIREGDIVDLRVRDQNLPDNIPSAPTVLPSMDDF